MIKKVNIGDVRITFSMARVAKVIGVNSRLSDDRHIIMWDFDDVTLYQVVTALKYAQHYHTLSTIYVLETKAGTNFIAYCFKAKTFREVCYVIVDTPLVDWNFFKYGVYRGRFTLRVTAKEGRVPKLVRVLESDNKPDVDVKDLTSWVRYQTLKG